MARNNLDHVDLSPHNLEYILIFWEGSAAKRPEEMLALGNGNETIDSYMSLKGTQCE